MKKLIAIMFALMLLAAQLACAEPASDAAVQPDLDGAWQLFVTIDDPQFVLTAKRLKDGVYMNENNDRISPVSDDYITHIAPDGIDIIYARGRDEKYVNCIAWLPEKVNQYKEAYFENGLEILIMDNKIYKPFWLDNNSLDIPGFDGFPEIIRLEGGKIYIFQDNTYIECDILIVENNIIAARIPNIIEWQRPNSDPEMTDIIIMLVRSEYFDTAAAGK